MRELPGRIARDDLGLDYPPQAVNTAQLEAAHLPPDPPTSAFERTLLPDFARWFVERVGEYKPDVFVPVETKGARLLETVLAYAREVLDVPLRVPVLYTPALAYADRAALAGLRVMLLDDATNTGRTLRRHRERVERYGVQDVSLVACVGAQDLNVEDEVGLEGLRWFTSVDDDMYREYLWQLAELVVARGLPPEVDHHVFRLSMRGALVDSWETLIDRLRHLGHLSLDGPVTTSADVISMTLHFPALPGAPTYPFAGPVRDEGVKKVRLFADIAHNTVHVVPMAFPAIDLDPDTDPDRVADDVCRAVVHAWTGGRETVADLLLDCAHTSDAELLFRVVSTATEVDLIRGFAGVLGAEFSRDVVALSSDRDLFARLYGRKVGDGLADRIDSEIAATFSASRAAAPPPADEIERHPPPRRLNGDVTAATVEIANYLKWLSDARSRQPGADPLKPLGMSLTELQREVPPASLDLELLSRCIDYGLAMTTLVPFTDVDRADDGTIKVRRKYRVSEIARGGREYEDVATSRQEVEEEVIALIARSLNRRTELWPDGAIPIDVVTRVATVLGPVVLRDQDAQLKVEPSPTGPQLVLGDPVTPKTIYSVQSELFRVDGAGITPSDEFDRRYDARALRLDRRGGSSTPIESAIKTLAPLLDASDNVQQLLFGWAAAASDHMGLSTAEVHLRRAVDELRAPLVPLLSGDRPDPKDFDHAAGRAEDLVGAARQVIAALVAEPGASARALWPEPDRLEQDILGALSCPNVPSAFLEIGSHLCDAAARLVALVRSLQVWGRGVETSDAEQIALALEVVETTTELERSLTSLSHDANAPDVPQEPSDARRVAAEELKRLLGAIRCRAAALAWDYRGEPRPRRVATSSDTRRVTVLAADLDSSTVHSVRESHDENRNWVHPALNLVGQWGRAFRGVEIPGREGDNVLIEFPDADCGLLCAAVVQLHTRALRESGRAEVSWEFRIAVDTGDISDGPGPNTTGQCLNIASKLTGFQDDDPDAADRVLLTPETGEACSADLRALIEKTGGEIVLEPDHQFGIDAQAVRVSPSKLDAQVAVARLLEGPADVAVEAQE